MTYFLLSLLGVTGLAILFLWLKIKKAALVESSLDNEINQRKAADDAKIRLEEDLRKAESQEKSSSVKEAIDRFNRSVNELRNN